MVLLGWSLGGLFARELAKLHPDRVRLVISLGSPISDDRSHTNAARLFEFTDLAQVEVTLQALMTLTTPLVAVLPRQPGQTAPVLPRRRRRVPIARVQIDCPGNAREESRNPRREA